VTGEGNPCPYGFVSFLKKPLPESSVSPPALASIEVILYSYSGVAFTLSGKLAEQIYLSK
jgi:hypothetical protein